MKNQWDNKPTCHWVFKGCLTDLILVSMYPWLNWPRCCSVGYLNSEFNLFLTFILETAEISNTANPSWNIAWISNLRRFCMWIMLFNCLCALPCRPDLLTVSVHRMKSQIRELLTHSNKLSSVYRIVPHLLENYCDSKLYLLCLKIVVL